MGVFNLQNRSVRKQRKGGGVPLFVTTHAKEIQADWEF